jgi:hypothetical protein
VSAALADLSLGIVTLVVVTASLFLTVRWHRREGHAEFVTEQIQVYEYPQARGGWRVMVIARNDGPAAGHDPAIWLVEKDTHVLIDERELD